LRNAPDFVPSADAIAARMVEDFDPEQVGAAGVADHSVGRPERRSVLIAMTIGPSSSGEL
jgi:hypothetical protein